MKSKLIKLSIDRYLSEVATSLNYSITNNKRVLVISAMGTGKTNYITNPLKELAKEEGCNILAVEPVKLLIEQINEKTNKSWGLYYGDVKEDPRKYSKMITTVDNSLNVAEVWEHQEKYFYVTVDESQEEPLNQGWRKAFKNIDKLLENPFCKGIAYFTATGEELKEFFPYKFDKIIEVEQREFITDENENKIKNPFKKPFSSKTYIHVGDWNKQNICTLRNRLRDTTNNPIFIKWDSIEGHRALEINTKEHAKKTNKANRYEIISTKKIKYLTDKENEVSRAKEEAFRENLKRYNPIKGTIDVWTTSVMNSGIEVNNDPSSILINVIDGNYTEPNTIQLVGRYRNGIQEYHLLIQEPKEAEKNRPIRGVKDFYKDLCIITKAEARYLNEVYNTTPYYKDMHLERAKSIAGIEIEGDGDDIKFVINEVVLKAEAIGQYQRQFLKHPKELKNRLEKLYGHILGDIEVKYSTIDKDCHDKEIEDIIKADKEQREGKVSALKEALYKELPLHFDNLENILDSEQYGFLTDEEKEVKDIISNVRQLSEPVARLEKKFKKIDIPRHLFWSYWSRMEDKELKEVLNAGEYIYFNKMYEENTITRKEMEILAHGVKQKNKKILRQYKTLEYFKKKAVKNGNYITKAIHKDLIIIYSNIGIKLYIENLKIINDATTEKEAKEKALNKLIKDINKYLGLIFKTTTTIKDDKEYVRFSSIRLDINDLI